MAGGQRRVLTLVWGWIPPTRVWWACLVFWQDPEGGLITQALPGLGLRVGDLLGAQRLVRILGRTPKGMAA